MDFWGDVLLPAIYHTDSVESTSKYELLHGRIKLHYTILTLWSQLQNVIAVRAWEVLHIPY